MVEDRVSIQIPVDLYEAIKRIVESGKGEFKNVEQYVEFVLREVLKEEQEPERVDALEEEQIKSRLRSLGYF